MLVPDIPGLPGRLVTYDFANWLIELAGIPLGGYDEEDAFSIEWLGNWWQLVKGLDANLTRNFDPDTSARITFNLDQMSDSNAWLTNYLMFDFDGTGQRVNITPFSIGIVSLVPQGGTFRDNTCWIERPPTYPGGKNSGVLNWSIIAPELAPLIS